MRIRAGEVSDADVAIDGVHVAHIAVMADDRAGFVDLLRLGEGGRVQPNAERTGAQIDRIYGRVCIRLHEKVVRTKRGRHARS